MKIYGKRKRKKKAPQTRTQINRKYYSSACKALRRKPISFFQPCPQRNIQNKNDSYIFPSCIQVFARFLWMAFFSADKSIRTFFSLLWMKQNDHSALFFSQIHSLRMPIVVFPRNGSLLGDFSLSDKSIFIGCVHLIFILDISSTKSSQNIYFKHISKRVIWIMNIYF